jgi:hypothetical protein
MKKDTFTIDNAIEIQSEQLLKWKKVLQTDVFYEMLDYCQKTNVIAKNTYDIQRGTNLDQWIHNYMNNC